MLFGFECTEANVEVVIFSADPAGSNVKKLMFVHSYYSNGMLHLLKDQSVSTTNTDISGAVCQPTLSKQGHEGSTESFYQCELILITIEE